MYRGLPVRVKPHTLVVFRPLSNGIDSLRGFLSGAGFVHGKIAMNGEYNMKYFWIAAIVQENGRHYAFAFRVSENDNLKCRLDGVQNLSSANIMPTKKAARDIVTFWNDCFKENGTYLFDRPGF